MRAETNRNPFRCFDLPFLLGSVAAASLLVALSFFARRFEFGSRRAARRASSGGCGRGRS